MQERAGGQHRLRRAGGGQTSDADQARHWLAGPDGDRRGEQAELVRMVWVAGLRLGLAEEAGRLRARCMLRAGSVAAALRWDELAGDGQ